MFKTGYLIISLTAAFILINYFSITAGTNPVESVFLNPNYVTVPKKAPAISDKAKEFLEARDGDKAKVWVFFIDKGISDKTAFDKAASATTLSEKVLNRRSKVNLDYVVFADLPVYSEYIADIEALGGTHRISSKWQNAASFEIPIEKLFDVAALPFVAEIRPLASVESAPLPEIDLSKERFGVEQAADGGLNYGSSVFQISQIKVDVLHNLGFHGEGVTLAILDTGFRKSHSAFSNHYTEGRVLGEHDFVFDDSNTANEPGDDPSQWSHGTFIWSVCGGESDANIYGPAFKANFLLAKTEYIPTETQIEEDYWVAAVEWADSLGADVLTSSLAYIDWYSQSDLDGATAVTTIEANMAASMGIVLCNAAGNAGPTSPSLHAPADAFDILAVGAVNGAGTLASFSSRGPTADGRTKPEVCARGVSTWAASAASDSSYANVNGTSLSTPLVAGAACLLVQARPNFPPQLIRQAFMETASNSGAPNNNYGWGIIDLEAAYNWGAEFSADTTVGNAPMTIQFSANTSLAASSWDWDFGDGGTATEQNPSYEYTNPGTYDVSLTIGTIYGPVTNQKISYISLFGDTLDFENDSAFAGNQIEISVNLKNTQELEGLIIPFRIGLNPNTFLDSVTRGTRTSYFEKLSNAGSDLTNKRYGYQLIADDGGGALPLPPGSGEILRIYATIENIALGGQTALLDSTSLLTTTLQLTTPSTIYIPAVFTGGISTKAIIRGDANYDMKINILDLTFLVDRLYRGGPPPITIQSGDLNQDLAITIQDLTFMVDWIFRQGPPPPSP